MSVTDITLILFTIFNTLRLFSYIPQMIVLVRDTSGAASISVLSWFIWVGANATTAAHLHLIDAGATVVAINVVNTLCCVIVMALIIAKRRQHRRRTDRQASARQDDEGGPSRSRLEILASKS